VVSEYLAPVPGRPDIYAYGFIPPGLFAQIKARLVALAREKKSKAVGADICHKSVWDCTERA